MRASSFIAVFATIASAAAPTFTNLTPLMPPTARRSSGGALVPGTSDTFVGYGGFTGAGAPLTDLPVYRSSTNSWTTSTPGFPGRERHGLAYDPVSDRFVIFGGINGVTVFDTTYLLSGPGRTPSTPPAPTTRPAARADPVLQWIPYWGRFLVFGGRTSVFANNFVNDTWSLSVADGGLTWATVSSGTSPSARGATCTAYDTAHDVLLLFGGEANNNLADTWAFAPDGGGWRSLTVSGNVPSARSFTACAWEPNLGELVLYGGQGSTSALSGLWTFNPVTNVWTSYTLSMPNPGALSDSVAVYSPALGGVLLFGGRNGSGAYVNELWLITFNQPPQVDAGPSFAVGEGVTVTLRGSVMDPDGDPTTQSWTQLQGPAVTLSSPGVLMPTFTSPSVFVSTPLRFQLTASDGTASASTEVTVRVDNTVNDAPLADAGADQAVFGGEPVTLEGSAVDPNGDAIASVAWQQVAGTAVTLSSPATLRPSFTAPTLPMTAVLRFELVVGDGNLLSLPDSVSITVQPAASPVDAGAEPADGGPSPSDAGTPVPDGGPQLVDAGTDADAGTTLDAGTGLDGGADADGGAVADGGAGADGGAKDPDAGTADAGAVDGGFSGDAGLLDAPDAGVQEPARSYAVGCGCAEASFSAAWSWLGLLLLWRRRR